MTLWNSNHTVISFSNCNYKPPIDVVSSPDFYVEGLLLAIHYFVLVQQQQILRLLHPVPEVFLNRK